MKIRPLLPENYDKVTALLKRAFPKGAYETRLFKGLHTNERRLKEWVCLQRNLVIAYICFSRAYEGAECIGYHLAPLAVHPQFQNQGVGGELIRFALRQPEIREQPVFVLGPPDYYRRFGFQPCALPICPFNKNNSHFLAIRNSCTSRFVVGYEPEFTKPKRRELYAKS